MFQHINKDMAGGSRAATDQYDETIQLDLRVIIAVVMKSPYGYRTALENPTELHP